MAPNYTGCRCLSDIARVYLREIDDAIMRAGGALAVRGRSITCRPGCSACCSLPVNATFPEAVLVSVYIRETFGPDVVAGIVERSYDWLEWTGRELKDYADGPDLASVYSLYGPSCPLLSGNMCSIYHVRPMGCRVHCSTTSPNLCGPDERLNPRYNPSGIVEEVVDKVKPFCMSYRKKLEEMGFKFEALVRPLPEQLVELLGGCMPGGRC